MRSCHWLMATSVIVLICTGWMIQMAPALYPIASDYHYLSAYVLIAALLPRLYLLFFGRAAAH